LSWLAKTIFFLISWEIVGNLPKEKKFVIIIGPHTSNWDFFMFILVKFACKLRVSFIGKHTIFIGPAGWVLRKLGGIPVERSSSHNVVDTIVDEFLKRESMIFALSPEGTRSYLDHWKSGFYHIARKANVPVVAAFLDTQTKTIGWGPSFIMGDDKHKDLNKIREFFVDKKGFKQHRYSLVRFLD
jgi:1-acyl-sn-glycerol-3-phosphate acyltransferase